MTASHPWVLREDHASCEFTVSQGILWGPGLRTPAGVDLLDLLWRQRQSFLINRKLANARRGSG